MANSPQSNLNSRRALLQCAYCHTSKLEAHLFRCQACLIVRYCNAECQRADWKTHKPACKQTQLTRATIAQNVAAGLHSPTFPDDLPLDSVQPVLKAWCDAHRPTFSLSLLYALGARQGELRGTKARPRLRDNVLWVVVRYRPDRTRRAERFAITHAVVRTLVDASAAMGGPQVDAIWEMLRQKNDEVGPELLGVGAVVMQYREIVNVLPFGIEKGWETVAPLAEGTTWEEMLMEVVNSGKKL